MAVFHHCDQDIEKNLLYGRKHICCINIAAGNPVAE